MRTLLAALFAFPLVLGACGGDGDDGPTPSGDPTRDSSAPRLSDTDYVQALCDGVEEWADALTYGSIDQLRETRAKIEADAAALNPPEGVDKFHSDYVQYLKNAESDPTLLTTQDPPLPEGQIRERLSEAERSADCAYPFFNRGEPTATPGS